MSYLAMATRVALLLVFAVSASSKLRSRSNFRAFAESIRPLLTGRHTTAPAVAATLAATVIAVETGCAVLLLIPTTVGFGHVVAVALLAALTVAVGWAITTARQASCRCFGVESRPLGRRHLVRNLVLLLAGGCGLYAGAVHTPVPMHAAGAVIAVAAGGVAALILINLDAVVDLLRPADIHRAPIDTKRRTGNSGLGVRL